MGALSAEEFSRYSRQLLLPGFGVNAQTALKDARVLIVGAGGLGCPAAQYLAAGGVGHLTIVDADVVETSNLSRQILHTDERVGMNKAQSIVTAIQNARDLTASHDLVLDCTDNVMTRYLISDAAVLADRQVVSGAAQGYEGQLIVLHKNLGDIRGPCYRCLFPEAPKPQHTQSCDDGGILGSVTGLIGTLQAIEAIKLLTGVGEATQPTILFATPFGTQPFRSVRVRPIQTKRCRACGDPSSVDKISDLTKEDYRLFCNLTAPRSFPVRSEDVGILDLRRLPEGDALVVDVRPPHEYAITALSDSQNLSIDQVRANAGNAIKTLPGKQPVLVVCRSGNDSREAVHLLQSADPSRVFANVTGGLRSYARYNPSFKMY
ncbi:hypothetical protein MYAM1_000372 [Malassezia yamatoensis]|uniref:Rhodanese domain-containing protein n=1 Tax=Malassezia yamatoensis TaxID=253288 RepID=A0AAJ5YNN9_9BASI|nr:hypothetical protein MYAM1_000372 [Malassezia yamatoensis]